MNEKFHVPFDTARQLKEKGYPQDKSDYGYFDNGDSHPIIMFPADNFDCAAPTYHEVVDWLEGKGMYVFTNYYDKWAGFIRIGRKLYDVNIYPTREEALNAAILKALEML